MLNRMSLSVVGEHVDPTESVMVSILRARSGRVTAWVMKCSECGPLTEAAAKKHTAEQLAAAHCKNVHGGGRVVSFRKG